jgi:hypothetical protein
MQSLELGSMHVDTGVTLDSRISHTKRLNFLYLDITLQFE